MDNHFSIVPMRIMDRLTRVSSATSRNKYQQYLSCQRLRKVQSLLGYGNDHSCDAILCVLGVDSKFNEGCREFANYLTLGFFSSQRRVLEEAKLEDEDMEDVIILVRSNSVAVFCVSYLYPFLLPYVACWRNVQMYTQAPENNLGRDADYEEAYKVKSFISMLKDCKKIGIPFLGSSFAKSLGKSQDPKSKFSIESWPLILAFGEDVIGCGEPFQARHAAVDIRNQIMPLYNECSPFVLGKVIKNSYPLFKRHWDEAVTTMSNVFKNKNVDQLNEELICEPLLSYFKHGNLMKLSRKGMSIDQKKKPCVLFGTHTADFEKESKSANFKSSARKGIQTPVHMVMQCVSPNEPLLCTRTYFFRPESKSVSAMKEFNNLVHLYTVCTQGCNLALNEFISTLSISKAESKGAGHLLSKGLSCGLVFDAKCTITTCDKLGNKVNMKGENVVPYAYNITLGFENVKTSHNGDMIGSVMFSDSFAVSSFQTETNDQEPSRDTVCDVLTSDIPVYMEWMIGSAQSLHDGDGEPMAFLKDVTVCSASPLYSPPSRVNVQFNQDGSVILSSRDMGDIYLKSGIQFFDSPNPGEVCILIVNFDVAENSQQWECIPPNFRGDISIIPDIALSQPSKCLILGLMPATQAYKEFYAVVVHRIQNDPLTSIAIRKAKTVSDDVQRLYNLLQDIHKTRKRILKSSFSKSEFAIAYPSYDYFMSHLTLSTVAQDYVVPDDVSQAICKKIGHVKDAVGEDVIPVSIISGHPSSGADDIGLQLINLNKERVRWVVIRPVLTSQGIVNRKLLEEQLSQAAQNKRVSRPSAAARKKLRIVVIATGFFDLCEVIQCVTFHSEMSIRKQISIGAVTVCVNPNAIHMVARQNYPKYFDQFLQGIANIFVFVIEDKETPSILDDALVEAQQLIRNVNKQAAFIICPGGKLMRKNDFDMILAEDSFSQPICLAERFLLRPELHSGKYVCAPSVPNITKINVEFSQPVLKGSFSARLRGLKSSMVTPQPFGSICFVSGCVAFTDQPKQDFSVSFCSATKRMDLIPHEYTPNQPAPPSKSSPRRSKPYYLDFYGIDMNEDELKDWLRKCGRQKPSKKSHKTKNRLTKSEIDRIQEGNCTRSLPEGYFYNGSFYVNLFDNKKALHHPYMPQFIDEYLSAENQKIDAFNADIEKQNIKDIFD